MARGTKNVDMYRDDSQGEWIWLFLMVAMIGFFGLGCAETLLSDHFQAWNAYPQLSPEQPVSRLFHSAVVDGTPLVVGLYTVAGFFVARAALGGRVRTFLESLGVVVGLLLLIIITSALGQERDTHAVEDVPVFSVLLYLLVLVTPLTLIWRYRKAHRIGR